MSPPIARTYLVEGDRKPDLSFEFEDTDLDDFDPITLHVRREDGSKLEIEATIDDADTGEFHFEWAADDLAEGRHLAEIEFVHTTGAKPETWPAEGVLELIVRERV
jgi:hypothetical protein